MELCPLPRFARLYSYYVLEIDSVHGSGLCGSQMNILCGGEGVCVHVCLINYKITGLVDNCS